MKIAKTGDFVVVLDERAFNWLLDVALRLRILIVIAHGHASRRPENDAVHQPISQVVSFFDLSTRFYLPNMTHTFIRIRTMSGSSER